MNVPQQARIIISGVGGQGILFVTRLLAEAAIESGLPVLTSETHGMAQRGGTVISHLKAGSFASPLVRPGEADLLLAMKEENLALHGPFLRPGGSAVVNSSRQDLTLDGRSVHCVDGDALAVGTGSVSSLNLILLGFALGLGERWPLFCGPDTIRGVMAEKLADKASLLTLGMAALDIGMRAARDNGEGRG